MGLVPCGRRMSGFCSCPDRADTSYSTTLKMIQVLHAKGFLLKDDSVRPQVYRAAVERETVQANVLQDVIQRVFWRCDDRLGAMCDPCGRCVGG